MNRFFIIFYTLIITFNLQATSIHVPSLIKEQEKSLNTKYSQGHKSVLNALNEEEDLTDLNLNQELKDLYFQLAKLNFDQFFQDKKQDRYDKAVYYINICEELEYKNKEIQDLLKKLKEFKEDNKKSIFNLKWLFGLSYLSWIDQAVLTSNYVDYKLNATVIAYSLNYSVLRENYWWGKKLSLSIFYGTANIGESLDSISYFQPGVNVKGVILTPYLYYRPKSGSVRLGFGAPIMYRKSNYEAPISGGEISTNDDYFAGFEILSNWQFNKFNCQVNLAKMQGLPSLLWKIGLEYQF
jgi:hypothetical protein